MTVYKENDQAELKNQITTLNKTLENYFTIGGILLVCYVGYKHSNCIDKIFCNTIHSIARICNEPRNLIKFGVCYYVHRVVNWFIKDNGR